MSRTASPRHPEIEVGVRSSNPLVLVAEVREALRLARVDRREIGEFSQQALGAGDLEQSEKVCRRWVRVRG